MKSEQQNNSAGKPSAGTKTSRKPKQAGKAATGRKPFEDILLDDKTINRLFIENAKDWLHYTSADGTTRFASSACEKVTGYAEKEFIANKDLLDRIVHPDDRISVVRHFSSAHSCEGSDNSLVFRIITKAGEVRWISHSCVIVKSPDGAFVGRWATNQDITEHKRVEEALRASARMIDGIINAMPVRVFWKDKNLIYLGCNAAFARDAGYADPKDLIGHDDFYMGWRDQAELYRANDRDVIECGRAKLLIEEPQTTPSGENINLLTSKLPLLDENGAITGVLGMYMDITERKRMEDALRESEERYRLQFLNMDSYNSLYEVVVDKEGKPCDFRFVTVNRAYEKYVGKNASELIGKTLLEVYPATEQYWIDKMAEVASTGVPSRFENFSRVMNTHTEINLYVPQKGQLAMVTANIDKRKQAEDELKNSKESYQRLVENIGNEYFFYKHDTAGVFTYISPSVTGMLGYSVDEFLVHYSEYLTTNPTNAEAIKHTNLSLQGELQKPYLVQIFHKDGSLRWLEVKETPLFGPDGKVAGVEGLAHDITERKRAEEALRESEEKHRALVEGLPDIIMRFDREGRHLFVSENIREKMDMEAAQFIGKTHAELGFPEFQCRFWEDAIRQVFDTSESFETEFAVASKAGAVTFNWRLVPEMDAQGTVSSVLSISRDITAFRKTEQQYKVLFSEMLDGFALHEIICDAEGKPVDYRFLAVNPAFERITGLKAADLVGRTVMEVLPGTEKRWIETYGKVALSGEPVLFENYSAVFGKHFEVSAFCPVVGRFVCIIRDVTVQKRAEEALLRFNDIVKNVPVGLHIYHLEDINDDRTLMMTYANPASEQITGISASGVVGKTLDENFPLLRAMNIPQRYAEVVRSGMPKLFEDVYYNDSRVMNACFSVKAFPLPNHHVGVAFENIIERKRADEERAKLQDQLERAQRMEALGILAGGVAHDLNNVLGPIILLPEEVAEYIKHHGDPADSECGDMLEALRVIEQSAKRAAGVVSDLVVMGRRGQFQQEPVDVNRVVGQVLEAPQVKKLRKGRPDVLVQARLTDNPVWCIGSEARLGRVLANLVGNAMEAIDGQGDVLIETTFRSLAEPHAGYETVPAGDYAVITVSDTGCGMATAIMAKIFEPFFSTKTSSTRSGSGLGLSVVHGLVKDHAGYVDVTSQPGKGSVFTLYFPAVKHEAVTGATIQAPLPGGSERILLVDDEQSQQIVIQRILKKLGYVTTVVSSGEAAVALFEEAHRSNIPAPFDLVVTDMLMKGMNGILTGKAIRKFYPGQKMLVVSGHATDALVAEAKAMGIKWLSKPYSTPELANAILDSLAR